MNDLFIYVTGNLKFSILNIEDKDILFKYKYKWYFQKGGYLVSDIQTKTLYLHKCIIPVAELVDHTNRVKFDNRRSNLRIANRTINGMNRDKTSIKKSSKYKGVSRNRANHRWFACIKKDYKNIHLGSFINEEDAAKAYNEAALRIHGKYAILNIL